MKRRRVIAIDPREPRGGIRRWRSSASCGKVDPVFRANDALLKSKASNASQKWTPLLGLMPKLLSRGASCSSQIAAVLRRWKRPKTGTVVEISIFLSTVSFCKKNKPAMLNARGQCRTRPHREAPASSGSTGTGRARRGPWRRNGGRARRCLPMPDGGA